MAKTDIITGQFVRISQTPASVGERVVARLIDTIIIVVYSVSTTILISHLEFRNAISWTLYLLLFLPAATYSFLCEMFNHGQSLGKYIMKIRVVKADGSTPSIGALLLRWILVPIDIYLNCLGILFIACSSKNQRIGDFAAGTMVIKLADYKKMHISLDDFDFTRKDYNPRYAEAQKLSLGQIDVITKAVTGTAKYDKKKIAVLATKTKTFLSVQAREESDIKFLSTLLHDYMYYAMKLI